MSLHAGDCIEVMRELDEASVDAIVTDPPYGIGFMGHEWDQPGEFSAVNANGEPGLDERVRSEISDAGQLDLLTEEVG